MPYRNRVIVNSDAKNEADDQYAIVHALLSDSLDIRGIIPAHFGTHRTERSMEESREEVDKLLGLMGAQDRVVVANGAPHALVDESSPVPSEGSRLIIDEALAAGSRLFVAFLGPLTDMASALLERPEIADRDVVVVWIGGPPYGDTEAVYGPEFNLSNDIAAANVVYSSAVEVWQVPMSVYTMVGVGYAELEEKVRPLGPLGDYLVQQVIDFNATHVDHDMEHRSLGDSPAIGVILNPFGAVWTNRPRQRFTESGGMAPFPVGQRTVRVCEAIDTRWLVEDLFSKLRRNAAMPGKH